LPDVTIKSLLEAGVHFGHRTRRWNPKMKRFIFEERNGIHILDLQKTIPQLRKAGLALRQLVLQGRSVLFVGTKKQAKEAIYQTSTRCGMFYVNERWLGGTLTNNRTLRKSIGRLRELEAMSEDGLFEKLHKKEVSRLLREKAKLHKYLDGIKDMDGLPAALFIVDTRREKNAIAEAKKTGIIVAAMVDSNSDPDPIDYPIAANDDAIKSITLISEVLADYIVEAQNELYKTEPEPVPRKKRLETVKPGDLAPEEEAPAAPATPSDKAPGGVAEAEKPTASPSQPESASGPFPDQQVHSEPGTVSPPTTEQEGN
jgi:small subunit ribosomal protein S2